MEFRTETRCLLIMCVLFLFLASLAGCASSSDGDDDDDLVNDDDDDSGEEGSSPKIDSIIGNSTNQTGKVADGIIITGKHLGELTKAANGPTVTLRSQDDSTLTAMLEVVHADGEVVEAKLFPELETWVDDGKAFYSITLATDTGSDTKEDVNVLQGEQGPSGPEGPSGRQGEDGATGPSGPAGTDGQLGPSGPTGPAGPSGPAGGPSGPIGPSGPVGATGASGPAGATGPSGPAGATGASGPAGATGPSGPAGATGASGPAGATGASGPAGATGASGPVGSTGPSGPAGSTGAAGPSGPTGPSGEQFWLEEGSTGNVYYNGGNVGIGTGSPNYLFDVSLSETGVFGVKGVAIGGSSAVDPISAEGDYSLAAGFGTTASGTYSFASGYKTTALGLSSTAMGDQTTATGWYSTATGYNTKATGTNTTAIGRYVEAVSNYSIAMGRSILVGSTATDAQYSFGIGLAQDSTPPVITQDNTMAIMGGRVGIGTVSPDYLLDVILGEAGETGVKGIRIGGGEAFIPISAEGDYALATGYGTTASGNASTAMGGITTASGVSSTAIGSNTIAGGNYSTALGNSINMQGDYSFGIGLDYNGSPPAITQPNILAIMGGRVGIQNVMPGHELDVNGNIRAWGMVLPGYVTDTCTSAIEGGIRYGTTSNTLQVCSGNSGALTWQTIFDGGKSGSISGTGTLPFPYISYNIGSGVNGQSEQMVTAAVSDALRSGTVKVQIDPTTGRVEFKSQAANSVWKVEEEEENEGIVYEGGAVRIGSEEQPGELAVHGDGWIGGELFVQGEQVALQSEIDELRDENEKLRSNVDELSERLARLEAMITGASVRSDAVYSEPGDDDDVSEEWMDWE
jgi:Collagen triple helix repeat (20 copies)/YadA head domain repeat (2 copies)